MLHPGPFHQLSEAERSFIAKEIVKNEHTIEDFKMSAISANGNFGEYYRIEMTIKEKNSEPKIHKFFMKSLPLDTWKADYLVNNGLFQKEVQFYVDISGCFRKFLSADMCPKYFLATPGKIVMTDAISQDYRQWKAGAQQLYDYEHTKIGLMALARLHAGSIIYEEKTGRSVGEDFPDAAREGKYKVGGIGLEFLRAGGEAVAALAPHLETDLGRDPEAVALLQQHVLPCMMKLDYYCNEKFSHRKVICQGDPYAANMFYKYDNHGQPISAIFVDFQLTRLRSPAFEVNAFMYLNALSDDVKKWRKSLLDAYYEVITQEMRNCGFDANAIYPKEEFLQDCIFYQIVGLIYSLLYFPFTLVPVEAKDAAQPTREKANDFFVKDRSQELIQWYREYPLLRESTNGMIDELYQNFIKTNRGLTEFTS